MKTYPFLFFNTIINMITRMQKTEETDESFIMLKNAKDSMDNLLEGKGKPEYLMKHFVYHNSCLF